MFIADELNAQLTCRISKCDLPPVESHWLASRVRDVDYADILEDSDLVLFGESHTVELFRDELAANFSDIKAQGFDVGMEMFPTDMQPLLDRYMQTGEGLGEIEQFLDEYWSWDGDASVQSYLNFVESARLENLNLIALDRPYGLCGANLYACSQHLGPRDEWMAETIAEHLLSGNKMVALVGGLHLGTGNIINFLPEDLKSQTKRVRYVGGSISSGDVSNTYFDLDQVVDYQLDQLGISGASHMVDVDRSSDIHEEADTLIYHPRTEPPTEDEIEIEIINGEINAELREANDMLMHQIIP